MVKEYPTKDEVWAWLDDVSDPEIPVISICDLGIVRDVSILEDEVKVTLTPTYSGCPATQVIANDVERAIQMKTSAKVTVKEQISPPWTTDWLSARGKARLEAYGIAPPQPSGGPRHCPRCQSSDLEKISQFGSTPCKAQWRCRSCLEPFDYFKCI